MNKKSIFFLSLCLTLGILRDVIAENTSTNPKEGKTVATKSVYRSRTGGTANASTMTISKEKSEIEPKDGERTLEASARAMLSTDADQKIKSSKKGKLIPRGFSGGSSTASQIYSKFLKTLLR